MNDPSCVLSVVFWVAAVWALGHILFGSYFASLLDQWIRRRFNYDHQMYRLSWELFHKCEWDREYAAAQKKELVKRPRELTPEELAQRKRQSWSLYFTMWHVRMVRYFLECPFCHCFWAALLLTFAFSSASGALNTVVNSIAYCGVAAMVVAPIVRRGTGSDQPARSGCATGNCAGAHKQARHGF